MLEAQTLPRVAFYAAVALAALLLLALALRQFQGRLIYFPAGDPGPVFAQLPRGREVTIPTPDGLELGAWFVPAPSTAPTGAVLLLHGNGGHRGHRAPLAHRLAERGWAVLLLDYRGYGGNPGHPDEQGLYRDAAAAVAWLSHRPEVDPGRLVYFGESLGAGVAVAAAVDHPPAALILRSPFSSMEAVARHHYPFLPVRWLLHERYPSIERIRHLRCPLLVLAGEDDRVVPFEHSRRLFEASPAAAKRFVAFPGADHNDWELLAGDRLVEETVAFLNAVPATPPPR